MEVVISERAYSSICLETMQRKNDKKETGGVLLGHIDDKKCYILENVLPGHLANRTIGSFEYDVEFVDYLATHLANLYYTKLDVVGIWHTHFDSIDIFSEPDRKMNRKFVEHYGHDIVSGIVLTDEKQIKLTMYNISLKEEKLANMRLGINYIPEYYREYCREI